MAKKRKPFSARKKKLIGYKISLKARERAIRKEREKIAKDINIPLKEKKTLLNAVTDKGVKVQTELIKLQDKLNRVVKHPKKAKYRGLPSSTKGYRPESQWKVWEKADAEQAIMIDLGLNSFNRHSLSQESHVVIDIVNNMFASMGSTSLFLLWVNDDDDAIGRLLEPSDEGYEDDTDMEL